MADLAMTSTERENINQIMEIAEKLPPEEQNKLYYIGVGLAYSSKENSNGKSSTNE